MGWVDKGKFIAQLVLYVEDKGQLLALTATGLGGFDIETRRALLGILRSFKFALPEVGGAGNGGVGAEDGGRG